MSDCKIYPADTVDTVGENMSDSTIYPADTGDTVGENMSDCKIYPADTVDIFGNVWPTVGENIRNGIFGENVKVGYVNINKGECTSTDFSIINVDSNRFRINNIISFLIFPESITEGRLTLTISNAFDYILIRNSDSFSGVSATIKIIYKDII